MFVQNLHESFTLLNVNVKKEKSLVQYRVFYHIHDCYYLLEFQRFCLCLNSEQLRAKEHENFKE